MHRVPTLAHRWCQHSINILTLLLCILSEYQAFHHHEHYEWVTHMPGAFNKTTWPALGHKLEKGSNDTAYITKANSLRAESPRKHTSVDYENLYAMENYFWGIQKGLSLELGALDGSEENMAAPSQTGAFVAFGWDRILIEANPTFRQAMAQVSPEAFSVNAAICKKGALHYVLKSSTKHAPTSGIAEFMEASFIARFFPYLIPKGRRVASFDPATMINWADVSLPKDVSVVEVTCVTMQQVLDRAGVNRVNFMVLDVEGAELDVLKSVDWRRTFFDVICVETELKYRPKGYREEVRQYLTDRGYIHDRDKGRNSWFIRGGFEPSKRPAYPVAPRNRHGD